MCRRLRVGKKNLLVALLVSAAMCSACLCGSHEPLAIMPSVDQVLVKSPHSRCTGTYGFVLITGSTGSALRAVRRPNLVYAASATGSLQRSPLFASAIAATFVGRGANNAVSQKRCLVP